MSSTEPAAQDPWVTLDDIASRSARQMRAENFPVALRALPRGPRAQLARVYEFARFVDDVGDSAPGDRLALLDMIDADVRALSRGGATLPPVVGLRPVVDACAVPVDPFLDLIQANRMDQVSTRYDSFDELLGYCRLSAAPVGRIVLHIAGAASTANIADSDAVCAALQVLEHCQDVGEDARLGRVYLPAVELRMAGVPEDDLFAVATSPRLRRVISVQVARSYELLGAGRGLVGRLSGWARFAVSGYVAGGLATAGALRSADYRVLERHIGPGKARTALYAARLMVRT